MNYFGALEASLVKFCADLIEDNAWDTFKPFDYDTHATLNEFPTSDLLGIGELSVTNNTETYDGTVTIAVCTMADDGYLEKLRTVIGQVFTELKPGTHITCVDPITGVEIGKIIVQTGVTVLPVGTSRARPFQAIAFRFGSALMDPQGD